MTSPDRNVLKASLTEIDTIMMYHVVSMPIISDGMCVVDQTIILLLHLCTTGGRMVSCGGVRGHGFARAFINAIVCNCSLDDNYVSACKRRHLRTIAAAWADVDSITLNTQYNCGCSNTNIN